METERVVTAAPLDALVVEPSAQLEVDGAPAELGVVARALVERAHHREVAQRLVGAGVARQLVAVVDGGGEDVELLLERALPRATAQLGLG